MIKYSMTYMKVAFTVIFIATGNNCNALESPFISYESIDRFTGAELAQAFSEIDPAASIIANKPNCNVDVYKIRYFTTGSQGEIITSTAAVMVPNGKSILCHDKHPVLLHAHGTASKPFYDFSKVANINNPAAYRSTNLAINFASQGYIVIAPNYAGYDESSLNYHPYLSSEQQANEMYDVYIAASHMLGLVDVNTSDKLFISGYSQGGYVALATSRLFTDKGRDVTAVAPMSGPYSLLAFGDHIFKGNINLGANFFIPLLTLNYQKEYGENYINTYDIFQKEFLDSMKSNSYTHWSKRFENLPQGVFKPIALNEYSKYGFDNDDYLVKTKFRKDYLKDIINNPDSDSNNEFNSEPQNELRKILQKNDLRSYMPSMPVFLCGGNQDPIVDYDINTVLLYDTWANKSRQSKIPLDVTVLDVDTSNKDYRKQKSLMFLGAAKVNDRNMREVSDKTHKDFISILDKVKSNPDNITYIYHPNLVAPNCINATKSFFDSF